MSQNNAIPPLSRLPSSQTSALGVGIVAAGSGFPSSPGDTNNNNNSNGSSNSDEGEAHPGRASRVHDHDRPFPPPRIPPPGVHGSSVQLAPPTASVAPGSPPRIHLTAPLTPLSSSFRSRPRLGQATPAGDAAEPANPRGTLIPTETSGVGASGQPRSPVGEVSLTVPRPDGERAINEYVEAPFKYCCNQDRIGQPEPDSKRGRAGDCPKADRRHRQKGTTSGSGEANSTTAPNPVPSTEPVHRFQRHGRSQQPFHRFNVNAGTATAAAPITGNTGTTTGGSVSANAVTKQPVSFTKEPGNAFATRAYDAAGLSIMCEFCGRCRCESCREPPPLPSRWLCDNSCFCSADTVLDYASCLCCVKGLFYHCMDGSGAGGIDVESAGSCADEPCSCTGNRRASRWACLGALTLVMPCLLCYWPFRGCVAVCEACYARHAAQGCRCNPNNLGNGGNGAGAAAAAAAAARHHPITNDIGDSRDPEKRLLDPVTPEL